MEKLNPVEPEIDLFCKGIKADFTCGIKGKTTLVNVPVEEVLSRCCLAACRAERRVTPSWMTATRNNFATPLSFPRSSRGTNAKPAVGRP